MDFESGMGKKIDLGTVEEEIQGDITQRGKKELRGMLEHTVGWNDVNFGSEIRLNMDLGTVEEERQVNITKRGKKELTGPLEHTPGWNDENFGSGMGM